MTSGSTSAGWLALALDGDKHPVDTLASNVGHCLWSGVVDEDKAAVLVKHLLADDMFSGWGVRTLGASMGAYDPVGPHTGAVWPHDNALCVAGLVRYGFVEEAHRLVLAQLEAAAAAAGRMAVLCGFDRDDVAGPVRLPDGCDTRAWSAGRAPVAPAIPAAASTRTSPKGSSGWTPCSPRPSARCGWSASRCMGGSVTVAVDHGSVTVEDLPAGISVVAEPRRPLAAGS